MVVKLSLIYSLSSGGPWVQTLGRTSKIYVRNQKVFYGMCAFAITHWARPFILTGGLSPAVGRLKAGIYLLAYTIKYVTLNTVMENKERMTDNRCWR